MKVIKDGGSAFPVQWQDRDGQMAAAPGMTLRDYFAAKTMQSLVADELNRDGMATVANVARDAYRMADAMLAERAKGNEDETGN